MGKIVSIPDELYELVEHEVAMGDFANDAEFVASLIRGHRERKLAALIAALEKGERSGISPRAFDEIVADARERFRSQGA